MTTSEIHIPFSGIFTACRRDAFFLHCRQCITDSVPCEDDIGMKGQIAILEWELLVVIAGGYGGMVVIFGAYERVVQKAERQRQ